MLVDLATKTYSFGFTPQRVGRFGGPCEPVQGGPFLRELLAQICDKVEGHGGGPKYFDVNTLALEFPALFSPVLGTANCEPYEIQLSDAAPVRRRRTDVTQPRRPYSKQWWIICLNREWCDPAISLCESRVFVS